MSKPGFIKAALLLLVVLCGISGAIAHSRRSSLAAPVASPTDFAGVVIMSGFRPLAADLLWMRAEDLACERRYYELISLYNLITTLDPHFEGAWVYNASNLASRIAPLEDTPQKRWRWIREGLLYAMRGMEKNPRSDTIAFSIAFILYHEVPKDDYYIKQTLHDPVINPDRLSVIELSRRWAERGYETKPHTIYIDWVLEFIYRQYGNRAKTRSEKLAYLYKRLEIWRYVRENKPYAEKRAAELIKQIHAEIAALEQ